MPSYEEIFFSNVLKVVDKPDFSVDLLKLTIRKNLNRIFYDLRRKRKNGNKHSEKTQDDLTNQVTSDNVEACVTNADDNKPMFKSVTPQDDSSPPFSKDMIVPPIDINESSNDDTSSNINPTPIHLIENEEICALKENQNLDSQDINEPNYDFPKFVEVNDPSSDSQNLQDNEIEIPDVRYSGNNVLKTPYWPIEENEFRYWLPEDIDLYQDEYDQFIPYDPMEEFASNMISTKKKKNNLNESTSKDLKRSNQTNEENFNYCIISDYSLWAMLFEHLYEPIPQFIFDRYFPDKKKFKYGVPKSFIELVKEQEPNAPDKMIAKYLQEFKYDIVETILAVNSTLNQTNVPETKHKTSQPISNNNTVGANRSKAKYKKKKKNKKKH